MQNAPLGEHSAILLTCIKQPFVIKIFVLPIFEWSLKTGIIVTVVKIKQTKKYKQKEIQKFIYPIPHFHGSEIDHEIISMVVLLLRVDVSYKRKYVYEVLVNHLVKLAQKKNVVR